MLNYAIYNSTTGQITKELFILDDDSVTVPGNTSVGELSSLITTETKETHYFVANVITVRPNLDSICSLTNSGNVWLANGSDTITYGNALPNPTYYELSHLSDTEIAVQTGNITTGSLSLTTVSSGDYRLFFRAFPYQDKTIILTAT